MSSATHVQDLIDTSIHFGFVEIWSKMWKNVRKLFENCSKIVRKLFENDRICSKIFEKSLKCQEKCKKYLKISWNCKKCLKIARKCKKCQHKRSIYVQKCLEITKNVYRNDLKCVQKCLKILKKCQ